MARPRVGRVRGRVRPVGRQAFFSPAAQSLVPGLVGNDEFVADENRLLDGGDDVANRRRARRRAGWVRTAFAFHAVSFALSARVLRGVGGPARPGAAGVASPFVQAREALSALAAVPLLRTLASGKC